MAKLNYDETFVSTVHINYDLEYNGVQYKCNAAIVMEYKT